MTNIYKILIAIIFFFCSSNYLYAELRQENVKKVIMCSGKIYFDLLDEQQKQKAKEVSIVRIEQLYPFPKKQLSVICLLYTSPSPRDRTRSRMPSSA